MPFLDGIATSVHGIVLPDGVVALRPGRAGHAATRPRPALRRLRDVLGPATGDPRRDAGCRPPPRRAAARRGRLPWRLHARRGRHRRRLPAHRAEPTLRRRPRRDHARTRRRAAATSCSTSSWPGSSCRSTAAELEATILDLADASRTGGTWQAGVDTSTAFTSRPAVYDDGAWRWAERRRGGRRRRHGRPALRPRLVRAGAHTGRAERRAAGRRLLALRRRRARHGVGPLTAPPDRSLAS